MSTRPGTIRLSLRISRTTDESTSLERQETEGRTYAAQRWAGAPIVVYIDDGVSGASDPATRKGLGTAMREWQAGDVLLVWKIDRLARSLFGFVDLMRATEAAGVSIVAIHDLFDLSTAAGKLQASILAVVAEWERENIRTRVRNARRHLHKVGRWPGGRVPYGLRSAPHPDGVGKTLVRDSEAAEVIRHIVGEVADGVAPTAIARQLQAEGVPSPRVHTSTKSTPKAAAWTDRAVKLILDAPHIVGHQRDPITDRLLRDEDGLPLIVWDPIVSEEELAEARAQLNPAVARRAPAGRHWLYGIALCAACGGNLKRTSSGPNQPDVVVLRCKGPLIAPHPIVSVRAAELSERVRERVGALLGAAHIGKRVYLPGSTDTGDVERLRAFLTELEEDRKAGMYATGEALARFRQQYADTAKRVEELEAQPQREAGWTYETAGAPFRDTWAGWTDDQRGEWLRTVGATVTVSSPEVRRARVPLRERTKIDLGELNEVAEDLDALAGVLEGEAGHTETT